jgi:hypothetical protein
MKTYIGCKRIKAKPMTKGEYYKIRKWNIPVNENPNEEGYVVKYPNPDGTIYVSWSPKDVFEEAYREEETYPLVSTAMLMKSNDYKERFIAEYQQVAIRYKSLKATLAKWDNDELSFNPTCPRSIYNMQIRAMTDYIAVLEARAVMEDIKLPEV